MTTTTAPTTTHVLLRDGAPATVATTDQDVIDAIATLLGTQYEWDGGDELEDIANLIGAVRPHPGDTNPKAYRADFKESTGRDVPADWDMHGDEDDEDDEDEDDES